MKKYLYTSFLFLAFFTFILGGLYPLFVLGVGHLLFPEQAAGSLMFKEVNGQKQVVGSSLIGQSFTQDKYFKGRSGSDYNPLSSTYASPGPLVASKEDMGSGSALDPHLSVEGVMAQVPRVAKAQGMDEEKLKHLVLSQKEAPTFGFLGNERINIGILNLKLDSYGHQ
jgi:K+-transporting ATPase ATPase C chain